MSQDAIQLSGIRDSYQPGGTISGTVTWNLPKSPKEISVNLFWHTEGRGDRDLEVVAAVPFKEPGASGSKSFDLKIPDGPFSFSGKLISLSWGVEVVADGGKSSTRTFFLVTPDGKEISIG